LTTDEEARKFSAKEQPVSGEKETAETKVEETKGKEEEEEEVSEEGLNAETIEMVMNHTKKSRREVVKALRETNGDSVTAIIVISNSINLILIFSRTSPKKLEMIESFYLHVLFLNLSLYKSIF